MRGHSYKKPMSPRTLGANGAGADGAVASALALDWDDLKIFQAAVRAGDYTTAARRLGMDRTTVGRRLARLEESLMHPLWEKSLTGYQPTSLGQNVLDAAARMEQAVDDLYRRLGLSESRVEGKIRLAGSAGITRFFGSPIEAFLRRNASVSIEYIGALNAIDAVVQRQADIGIAIAREIPADIDAWSLGPFHQSLYVDRENPDNERRIGWGHGVLLANPYPWALLNGGGNANYALEVDNLHAMHGAVRGGVGRAWLWSASADRDDRLLRLEEPLPERARAELWLVTRADILIEPAVAQLRAELLQSAEDAMCVGL